MNSSQGFVYSNLACAADGVKLLAGGNNNRRLLFPPASNLTPSAAQANSNLALTFLLSKQPTSQGIN